MADDAGRLHGESVRAAIDAAIGSAGGWLSFEHYMDLALYAPGLGYYSAGARKLGAGGDFVTAPEVSPLFGACVARQCAEVLGCMTSGSILEIGAGTGRLASDVLARLESLDRLPARYRILETSADLRERQRELLGRELPQLVGRVEWLDAPPATAFDGLILANEVLDALPVRRFRWTGDGPRELGVVVGAAQLDWAERCARRGVTGTRATRPSTASGLRPGAPR